MPPHTGLCLRDLPARVCSPMRQAGRGTKSCLRPSLPLSEDTPATGQPSDLWTKDSGPMETAADSKESVSFVHAQTGGRVTATELQRHTMPSQVARTLPPITQPCAHRLFPPQTSFAIYFPTLVAHDRKNLCEIPRMVWPQHNSFKCPEVPVV